MAADRASQKNWKQAGEIALLVKCLKSRHEDLSSFSEPWKKSGTEADACSLSAEEAKTHSSLEIAGQQYSQINELQVQ